ncbi:MAG TPA: hypothetical protein VLZ83_01885 [Edaphocola sp.]|nr:hypothetical protein [Edaphocola sp.]
MDNNLAIGFTYLGNINNKKFSKKETTDHIAQIGGCRFNIILFQLACFSATAIGIISNFVVANSNPIKTIITNQKGKTNSPIVFICAETTVNLFSV